MIGRNFSIAKQRAKYVVTDYVTVALAFLLFDIFRYYFFHEGLRTGSSLTQFIWSAKILAEQILVPLCALGVFWISGYYNRPIARSRVSEFSTTFKSTGVVALLIYFALLINDSTGIKLWDYECILVLFSLLFGFTYLGRWTLTSIMIHRLRKRQWRYSTLIVGNSKRSRKVLRTLKARGSVWAYDVVGFIDLPSETSVSDGEAHWSWGEIEDVCRQYKIDQIILAPERMRDKRLMEILNRLFPLRIPVKIAPDTLSYVTGNIRLDDILGIPFMTLTSPRISEFEKNVKRLTDISVSLFTMICLSPVLAVTALAVKLSSKGPVIYSQERMGHDHRPFRILKFRSMRTDAEQEGPALSSDGDPRVTRWGRFMRKYRIDELPQFWNVLKGDMSLVGPRPEREYYIRQILARAPYYALIFQVRPGVTSWGMVQFGYASNVNQMVERSRFDLLYINNMSVATDIKILIHTIKTVLKGSGV